MKTSSRQLRLFDIEPDAGRMDEAALARGRMREMIESLRAATAPPWTEEMGVYLRDGEFKRAMWCVPEAEGAALWVEFDAQMERLYAIWAADAPPASQ